MSVRTGLVNAQKQAIAFVCRYDILPE